MRIEDKEKFKRIKKDMLLAEQMSREDDNGLEVAIGAELYFKSKFDKAHRMAYRAATRVLGEEISFESDRHLQALSDQLEFVKAGGNIAKISRLEDQIATIRFMESDKHFLQNRNGLERVAGDLLPISEFVLSAASSLLVPSQVGVIYEFSDKILEKCYDDLFRQHQQDAAKIDRIFANSEISASKHANSAWVQSLPKGRMSELAFSELNPTIEKYLKDYVDQKIKKQAVDRDAHIMALKGELEQKGVSQEVLEDMSSRLDAMQNQIDVAFERKQIMEAKLSAANERARQFTYNQREIQGFQQSSMFLLTIGQWTNSPPLQQIGKAGIGISNVLDSINTLNSLKNSPAGELGSLAMMGGYASVGIAVLGFASGFMDSGPSPEEVILDYLNQIVSFLETEFKKIHQELHDIHKDMLAGFEHLSKLISANYVSIQRLGQYVAGRLDKIDLKLESIEKQIEYLSDFSTKAHREAFLSRMRISFTRLHKALSEDNLAEANKAAQEIVSEYILDMSKQNTIFTQQGYFQPAKYRLPNIQSEVFFSATSELDGAYIEYLIGRTSWVDVSSVFRSERQSSGNPDIATISYFVGFLAEYAEFVRNAFKNSEIEAKQKRIGHARDECAQTDIVSALAAAKKQADKYTQDIDQLEKTLHLHMLEVKSIAFGFEMLHKFASKFFQDERYSLTYQAYYHFYRQQIALDQSASYGVDNELEQLNRFVDQLCREHDDIAFSLSDVSLLLREYGVSTHTHDALLLLNVAKTSSASLLTEVISSVNEAQYLHHQLAAFKPKIYVDKEMQVDYIDLNILSADDTPATNLLKYMSNQRVLENRGVFATWLIVDVNSLDDQAGLIDFLASLAQAFEESIFNEFLQSIVWVVLDISFEACRKKINQLKESFAIARYLKGDKVRRGILSILNTFDESRYRQLSFDGEEKENYINSLRSRPRFKIDRLGMIGDRKTTLELSKQIKNTYQLSTESLSKLITAYTKKQRAEINLDYQRHKVATLEHQLSLTKGKSLVDLKDMVLNVDVWSVALDKYLEFLDRSSNWLERDKYDYQNIYKIIAMAENMVDFVRRLRSDDLLFVRLWQAYAQAVLVACKKYDERYEQYIAATCVDKNIKNPEECTSDKCLIDARDKENIIAFADKSLRDGDGDGVELEKTLLVINMQHEILLQFYFLIGMSKATNDCLAKLPSAQTIRSNLSSFTLFNMSKKLGDVYLELQKKIGEERQVYSRSELIILPRLKKLYYYLHQRSLYFSKVSTWMNVGFSSKFSTSPNHHIGEISHMAKTFQLLAMQAMQYADMKNAENGVIMLGPTGAGKSVLVAHLLGCEMEYRSHPDDTGGFIMVSKSCPPDVTRIPEFGHQVGSKTLFPSGYPHRTAEGKAIQYIDFPGLEGNRGEDITLLELLSTQVAIKTLHSVKSILIVVPYEHLSVDSKALNFKDTLESISRLVKNMEAWLPYMALVVTKLKDKDHVGRVQVLNCLKKILEHYSILQQNAEDKSKHRIICDFLKRFIRQYNQNPGHIIVADGILPIGRSDIKGFVSSHHRPAFSPDEINIAGGLEAKQAFLSRVEHTLKPAIEQFKDLLSIPGKKTKKQTEQSELKGRILALRTQIDETPEFEYQAVDEGSFKSQRGQIDQENNLITEKENERKDKRKQLAEIQRKIKACEEKRNETEEFARVEWDEKTAFNGQKTKPYDMKENFRSIWFHFFYPAVGQHIMPGKYCPLQAWCPFSHEVVLEMPSDLGPFDKVEDFYTSVCDAGLYQDYTEKKFAGCDLPLWGWCPDTPEQGYIEKGYYHSFQSVPEKGIHRLTYVTPSNCRSYAFFTMVFYRKTAEAKQCETDLAELYKREATFINAISSLEYLINQAENRRNDCEKALRKNEADVKKQQKEDRNANLERLKKSLADLEADQNHVSKALSDLNQEQEELTQQINNNQLYYQVMRYLFSLIGLESDQVREFNQHLLFVFQQLNIKEIDLADETVFQHTYKIIYNGEKAEFLAACQRCDAPRMMDTLSIMGKMKNERNDHGMSAIEIVMRSAECGYEDKLAAVKDMLLADEALHIDSFDLANKIDALGGDLCKKFPEHEEALSDKISKIRGQFEAEFAEETGAPHQQYDQASNIGSSILPGAGALELDRYGKPIPLIRNHYQGSTISDWFMPFVSLLGWFAHAKSPSTALSTHAQHYADAPEVNADPDIKLTGEWVSFNSEGQVVPAFRSVSASYTAWVFLKQSAEHGALTMPSDFEISDNDSLHALTCMPMDFGGRPSVVCNNSKTTLVYQPHFVSHQAHITDVLVRNGVSQTTAEIFMQPFSDVTGNLMLLRLLCHLWSPTSHDDDLSAFDDSPIVDPATARKRLGMCRERLIHFKVASDMYKTKYSSIDWGWQTFCFDEYEDNLAQLERQDQVTEAQLDELEKNLEAYEDDLNASVKYAEQCQFYQHKQTQEPSQTWGQALFAMFSHHGANDDQLTCQDVDAQLVGPQSFFVMHKTLHSADQPMSTAQASRTWQRVSP